MRTLVLCYTGCMRLRRKSYLTTLTKRSASVSLLLLFAGTITLSIGLNLLLTITGITAIGLSESAATQTSSALSNYGLALSVMIYGIITPLVEEFAFRGMFYSAIYSHVARRVTQHRKAFLLAAGITSMLFGIYHMNVAQGLYAFAMGMVFCLAYELTGQFLSPWILHAACNIISLVLSQSVNGTNAFTAICTWPWTGCFIAITFATFITLRKVLAR